MASLEWYIARRYLSARRRGRFLSLITLIAVGGIAVGVMALITVIAVMSGLQRDLQGRILGSTPHIYVFETGHAAFRLGNWEAVLPRILEQPEVVSAEPFVLAQVGIANFQQYAQPGRLHGIDPFVAREPITDVERQIRDGTLALGPTQSGLPGILIGRDLAGRLQRSVLDTVLVASLERYSFTATGDLIPRVREFEVTGIFHTGMYEYDVGNTYAELSAVQDLLGLAPDTVSGIAVNTIDATEADRVAADLEARMGYSYYANSWIDTNQPLFEALKLEKLAMAVILFLIVLVAAFNIVSTLIMVVADKTREIGILKALGMTDTMVLRVFMLQGLAIGVIGTALGALGGIALVSFIDRSGLITLPAQVYFIDRLPVALEPFDFTLIIVLSILISFVATLYPSRQASRLLPVDAIRHE